MKLYTTCKNCKSDIGFNVMVEDRIELKMQKGEEIELTCKKCNHTTKYPVKDIYAKKSKLLDLLAGAMFLFGAGIIFVGQEYFMELSRKQRIIALLGLLVAIYAIYKKIKITNIKRTNLFNGS